MSISACMIVKNEEKMLEKTLPNLASLVDEIILVDTGSSDKTIEIAKKCGAKVYSFPWINDFSAARNESLKYASSDWIIWVDADEYIKKEDFAAIKEAAGKNNSLGFMLKIGECNPDTFTTTASNYRPKIFRNGAGIHFERPINEMPYTKDGQPLANLIKPIDSTIYHWGYHLPEGQFNAKRERNVAILKSIISIQNDDPAYLYLLAKNLNDLTRYDEAINIYNRICEALKDGPFYIQAKVDLSWLYHDKNMFKEAFLAAKCALDKDKDNISAMNLVSTLLMAAQKYEEAIGILLHALSVKMDSSGLFTSERQKQYISNYLLSNAYFKIGDKENALEAAKRAEAFEKTDEIAMLMEQIKCQ